MAKKDEPKVKLNKDGFVPGQIVTDEQRRVAESKRKNGK